MNKLTILFLGLTLLACASGPDLRPDIYSKGENLLSNGVLYYNKDNFSAAQQNFYRALVLYRSMDHAKGVQLARINYIESLLALNNFDAAEEQLAILKTNNGNSETNVSLKDRVILLEVKLLFQKQRYREALAVIEPLLLQTEQQEISDNKRLELLATAARLEALIAEKTDGQWVNEFREVLLEERKIQPKYKVILKRIDAVIATQNKHYNEALKLLHEALTYYKDQVNRRAIAACLEEIAEIEFKQQHYSQELEYLKKALSIRVWLKDQYHTDKIQKRIVKINTSP